MQCLVFKFKMEGKVMYICPTCKKEYVNEEEIKKHSMACWRKANTNHKSKSAPQ